ncbi:uncharacterized protein RSE6_11054 [Rhynchosporium secalis]|uniref:Uncharacterized protein n=1 Tax=Rhynchosporium secalis TaxID=38038 RepID=A0A1E1MM07_RHYSE|nr:uncharacterized protein RSE6_11054 [Rhynchosporium secalis]
MANPTLVSTSCRRPDKYVSPTNTGRFGFREVTDRDSKATLEAVAGVLNGKEWSNDGQRTVPDMNSSPIRNNQGTGL